MNFLLFQPYTLIISNFLHLSLFELIKDKVALKVHFLPFPLSS
jgi:hypothetical protein